MKALFLALLMVFSGAGRASASTMIGIAPPTAELIPCADTLYRQLLTDSRYELLPNWYMAQMTRHLFRKNPKENAWQQTFEQLPTLEALVVLRRSQKNVSALWLQRGLPVVIAQVETVPSATAENCLKLSQRLRGIPQEDRFRSPLLSAGLSTLIPGAGHYYRNTPEGFAMGSFYLLSYLTLTYLALSNTTSLERSQWGGMILGLSLTDILSAYYLELAAE